MDFHARPSVAPFSSGVCPLWPLTSFWLDDSGLDPKRFSRPLSPARRAGAVDANGRPSSEPSDFESETPPPRLLLLPPPPLPLLPLLLVVSPLATPRAPFSSASLLPACRHSPSKQRSFRVCPLRVSLASSKL